MANAGHGVSSAVTGEFRGAPWLLKLINFLKSLSLRSADFGSLNKSHFRFWCWIRPRNPSELCNGVRELFVLFRIRCFAMNWGIPWALSDKHSWRERFFFLNGRHYFTPELCYQPATKPRRQSSYQQGRWRAWLLALWSEVQTRIQSLALPCSLVSAIRSIGERERGNQL